ncbi:MAG: type IV toxin-antitoxin system AbiEi family antitoxin domain-containing protein [Coriobacteriia bacterium]
MNRLVKKIVQSIPNSIVTVQELVLLEPGPDNIRHALVKRAIADGDLIHIRRGLYCLSPLYGKNPIHPFALAQNIYGPSYISLESALSAHGWIPEAVHAITSVSAKAPREFDTAFGKYSYQRLPQNALYAGVEAVRDETGQTWMLASALKALADYVQLHKLDWNSTEPIIGSLRVEKEQLSELTTEDFKALEGNYHGRRARRFLAGLKKELGL